MLNNCVLVIVWLKAILFVTTCSSWLYLVLLVVVAKFFLWGSNIFIFIFAEMGFLFYFWL